MGRTAGDDETIQRRSGWLIPLSLFAVTFALSAGILVYYLAPPPDLFDKQLRPTANAEPVRLWVGGQIFSIPAHYLPYAGTRRGGERASITLFALLPDLSGWSNWTGDAFASNAPDADVVFITIHQERVTLSEADKLSRIYRDYLKDPDGTSGPSGLRQYAFRDDSGYHTEDLFVGSGPVVLRCVRPSPKVPSPNCLREKPVAPGVSLSYRFKRAHLPEWHSITAKIDALIAGFQIKASKP
jgi:hypothetical protein